MADQENGITVSENQENTDTVVAGPPEKSEQRDDICRDFLKNICSRGSRCKFYHPPDAQPSSEHDFNFCIDYQNRGCMRDNCRFVHAPREEVERYKTTRELTLILARAVAAASVSHCDTIAGIPICKEFQTGRCARGANRCRYWHVNVEVEKERRKRGFPPTNEFVRFPPLPPGGPMMPPIPHHHPHHPHPAEMYGGGGVGGKRRGGGGGPRGGGGYDNFEAKRARMGGPPPPQGMGGSFRHVEMEKKNAELQQEIESLRRELQREKERYEDLYALFRQSSGGTAAPPKTPAASSGTTSGGVAASGDYYAWAANSAAQNW